MNRSSKILTQDRLKEVLLYDPSTGLFTWLASKRGPVKAGDVAGNKVKSGYIYIYVDGRNYLASRLAWFFMTGGWPTAQIDHHDLDKSNNAWSNLRTATVSQNQANKRPQKNNSVGLKGVVRVGNKFKAQLKSKCLGRFETPEEAHVAYMLEAESYFGEYARA